MKATMSIAWLAAFFERLQLVGVNSTKRSFSNS